MHGRFQHLFFDSTARAVDLAIVFALLWFFVMLPGVLHATGAPTLTLHTPADTAQVDPVNNSV